MYLFINELDNCINDLQKALEKDPENAFINYKLGLGYYLQKQFVKAIFYLGQSIALKDQEDKADTFYHLGNLMKVSLMLIWVSFKNRLTS